MGSLFMVGPGEIADFYTDLWGMYGFETDTLGPTYKYASFWYPILFVDDDAVFISLI